MLLSWKYSYYIGGTEGHPFYVLSLVRNQRHYCATFEWFQFFFYRPCNRRRQVLNVFVEFYAAIFVHVYQVWKHQHKTISDSGFVLREAEKLAKKRPRDLHRNLERALADRQGLIKVDEDNFSPKAKQPDILDKFAGVCDLQVDEEEEVHLV